MKYWQGLATAAMLSLAGTAWAESGRGAEPVDWLIRMVQSAQVLNYGGTYTFSHDGKAETSRIVHINDGAGERCKVEALDGPQREIIRENNQIACYLPDSRLVKLDRVEGRHFFPSLLSGSPQQLRDFYNLSYAGVDRVAGRECQLIRLEPRDGMRFGYRLCADNLTGLMLRASLEDGTRGVLQQFAFTEIEGESAIDTSRVRPSWTASGWLWDRSGLNQDGEVAWSVASPPAGFRKVLELHRSVAVRGTPLTQLVYSDGIAAVSLFIETDHGGAEGVTRSRRGALSFYSSRTGDQRVTAIGEVPPATVAQMVNSATQVKTKP
jgi:sigma-E factor negative regulatory protein RseB